MQVGFKYPGTEKNTITNISLYCTLSSRVVVHGANGAGKSTMIKVRCKSSRVRGLRGLGLGCMRWQGV